MNQVHGLYGGAMDKGGPTASGGKEGAPLLKPTATAKSEFPYLLTIIVHGGSNLPVADMTSSDPYVTICLGSKEESRTKVIEKSLNPVWEHFVEIPCLHPHLELKFLVYDSDLTSADDLMGVVRINIDEYSQIGEVEDIIMNKKRFPLQQGQENIKPQGDLLLSVLLIRNKEIIALSRNTPTHFPEGSAGPVTEALLHSCGLVTGPRSFTDPKPIFDTVSPLRRALAAISTTPSLDNAEVTKDILMDVYNCLQQISRDPKESEAMSFLRRHRLGKLAMEIFSIGRRTSSSSSLSIESMRKGLAPSYSRELCPTNEICLTFHVPATTSSSGATSLSDPPSREVKLHLPNKYALWVWLRWVRLAVEVWEQTRESPLPAWAKSHRLVTTGATLEHVESYKAEGLPSALAMEYLAPQTTATSHTGTASLSLKSPYTIRIEDSLTNRLLDEFSFTHCRELGFSVDAPLAKTHSLQLELNGLIFKKNCPSGESYYCVVRSFDGHYHKTKSASGPSPEWDESVYLDCNRDHPTGAVDVFLFRDMGPYQGVLLGQARIKYSTMLADMTVISQDRRRLDSDDDIFGMLGVALTAPCDFRVTAVQGDDFHPPPFATQDFFLAGIVLKCALVDWNGKKTSPGGVLPTALTTDLKSPVAVWRGKAADWSGYTFQILPTYGIEWCRFVRVRVLATVGLVGEELVGLVYIPISDFGESNTERRYEVHLTPSKSATAAELTRLGRKPVLRLRCCRVPAGASSNQSETVNIAVDPVASDAAVPPRPPSTTAPELASIGKLTTHLRIRRSNEYTTYWAAEGVSATTLTTPRAPACTGHQEKDAEHFCCAPGYEGLVLENVSEEAMVRDRGIKEKRGAGAVKTPAGTGQFKVAQVGSTLLQPPPLSDEDRTIDRSSKDEPHTPDELDDTVADMPGSEELGSPSSEEVTVVIYQHQRRSIIPPFAWSHKALFCGDPPPYGDSEGHRCNFDIPRAPGTPTQALPPRDMEWIGDWHSDEWDYGMSFELFARKGQEGDGRRVKTLGAPGGCGNSVACVRRRRWIRRAAPIGSKRQYAVEISSRREEEKLKVVKIKYQHKYVIRYSQESCGSKGAAVVIPWSQVHSIDVISPSVLSINATIHKYFCDTKGVESYHSVLIDIFLTSCPAADLQSLMQERLEFARPMELADGTSAPNQRAQLVESIGELKDCLVRDEPYDFSVPLIEDGEGNRFPQAIEMPPGVLLCMMLDHDAGFQEDRANAVKIADSHKTAATGGAKTLPDSSARTVTIHTHSLERLRRSFQRGALRRRVYIAALHAAAAYPQMQLAGLDTSIKKNSFLTSPLSAGSCDNVSAPLSVSTSPSDSSRRRMVSFAGAEHVGFDLLFDTDELEDGVRRDFEAGEEIKMENSVATTKNRTNFLLDMFECRLRFLCLCGWLQQGGPFEDAVETLINGFFIVIVSKYARFFDSKVFEEFQGLNSKITLITTLMEHDNKLAAICEEALQVYDLHAEPTPSLSHFLKVDKVIAWYSNVLQEEMAHLVDRVVSQCQADSKNASAAEYTAALPWYPTRLGDSPLCSTMPEDIEKFLRDYLLLARLNEATVTDKFKPIVDVLDAKVYQSYAQSFSRLSKVYWLELNKANDWGDVTRELYAATQAGPKNTPARVSERALTMNDLSTATAEQIIATKRRAQELLDQRAEFICSVANDAMRINANRLATSAGAMKSSSPKPGQAAESNRTSTNTQQALKKSLLALQSVVSKVEAAFSRIEVLAIDTLSCMLFTWAFSNLVRDEERIFALLDLSSVRAVPSLLTGVRIDQTQAADTWFTRAKASYSSSLAPTGPAPVGYPISLNAAHAPWVGADGVLDEWLEDLQQAVEGQCDFLQADCYLRLVQTCLDKCVIHRLRLLVLLAHQGKKLEPLPAPESITLGAELSSLTECFDSLIRQNDSSSRSLHTQVDVKESLKPMQICVSLITSALGSVGFTAAMQDALGYSQGTAAAAAQSASVGQGATLQGRVSEDAGSWLALVQCCLTLRRDSGGIKDVLLLVGHDGQKDKKSGGYFWTDKDKDREKKEKDKRSQERGTLGNFAAGFSQPTSPTDVLQEMGRLASLPSPALPLELCNVPPVTRVFSKAHAGLSTDELLLHSATTILEADISPHEGGASSVLESIGLLARRGSARPSVGQTYTSLSLNARTPEREKKGGGSTASIGTGGKVGRWFGLGGGGSAEGADETSTGSTTKLTGTISVASPASSSALRAGTAILEDDSEKLPGVASMTERLSRIRSLTTMTYGRPADGSSSNTLIVLRSLHCKNLLYLSRLGSAPKPYLQFEFNGEVVHKTEVVDKGGSGLHPSWESDPAVEFSLPVDVLSTKYLHCFLYYSGNFYGEERVGVANISLSNLDIEPINDQSYVFNCSATEKGKKAQTLAEKEGRPLPMVFVTMAYKEDTDD